MPKEIRPRVGAITIYGIDEIRARLAGIHERLVDPAPLLEIYMQALEVGEVSRFGALAPHFVRTGAVRDSLTQSDARGAIREIHGIYAKFGTSIWYAKFLRAIDGPGKKPKGRKRVGPNLVLKLNAADRRAATRAAARFIARGT